MEAKNQTELTKAALILMIISIILTFLSALFFVGLCIFYFIKGNNGIERLFVVGVVFLIAAIWLLISGFLKLWALKLMKNPKTIIKGGIIALIMGALNSDLLSVIAGLLSIVRYKK